MAAERGAVYVCVCACRVCVCLYVSCLGTPLTRELPACCRKPCASVHLHIKLCDPASQPWHSTERPYLNWALALTPHHHRATDNESCLQHFGARRKHKTVRNYFPAYGRQLLLRVAHRRTLAAFKKKTALEKYGGWLYHSELPSVSDTVLLPPQRLHIQIQ